MGVSEGSLQVIDTKVIMENYGSTKRQVLAPISFRCSRLDVPGKDFVAIWVPVGWSSGLSL